MTYELCPFPLSPFEMKNAMRQPDKPQLAEAIGNQATNECDNIINQIVPLSDHYVLDGGSLLHRLKWVEGSSYSTIANEYAAFTIKHYGKATVVFDGYGNKADIQDCAHLHRYSKNVNAKKVNVTLEAKFVGKKEDFLSNKENKQALIRLIMNIMQQRGCTVLQAEGDADVEIVKTIVTMSAFKSTSLIGEDTYLLVLSLYHVQPTDCTTILTRQNPMFTTSKILNYFWENLFVMTFHFSMPLQAVILHPEYLELEKNQFSKRSSK